MRPACFEACFVTGLLLGFFFQAGTPAALFPL